MTFHTSCFRFFHGSSFGARLACAAWLAWMSLIIASRAACSTRFTGRIVDARTGQPLPARVYLRDGKGEWLFVKSAEANGSALPYREQWVPIAGSIERHTTVSAHPFYCDLPPGKYVIEIERGKEYRPFRQELSIGNEPVSMTFRLTRWSEIARDGWYSGETHVHRRIRELPNVMLAEDLNVAFPVTFWTTSAEEVPNRRPSPLRRQGPSPFGDREDRGADPIWVDTSHVILPRNTEYEIFNVNGRRHVLGALFILNHRSLFAATAPPVRPIARQAHREGALLDLDKHSWPWSLMLVPVAKVDLFELSNNSVWRTQFGFKRAPDPPPPWAELEMDGPQSLTEWGWLTYGFEMYYGLLNCGFQLAPSAGTASGVHPVPLGHSRVYVHTGKTFNLDRWLSGLRAGHSFVTTGPMLQATINGAIPGHHLRLDQTTDATVSINATSVRPLHRIEIIRNGVVIDAWKPQHTTNDRGALATQETRRVRVDATSWFVVRIIEPQPNGRRRFAHTAPWYISVGGEPLKPRRDQAEFFAKLMDREIVRNRDVLSPQALAEFEEARDIYRRIADSAR